MSANIEAVINRLFSRLQGIYGTAFTSKFSTGLDRNGVDQGFENAKTVWADELHGFLDNLDAIGYALKNTDPKFAPAAREFVALCRTAPKKEAPALVHKLTAEEIQRNREMAEAATKAVKSDSFDGLLWAKRPKSQKAMDMVADAKKEHRKFPALAAIFDQHVVDGVCNEVGKLIKRWDGVNWVKA